MDTLRGFEDDRNDHDIPELGRDRGQDQGLDQGGDDRADLKVDDNAMFDIGSDERRMHVRAYNYWVSLLGGRAYPSIEDLVPENIADFGAHSVLLDFTAGIDNPAIQFLGRALRDECDFADSVTHISQVPSRSLLSRLTDHYLQIIANHAPIGFEAEFVNTRGHNTMYRGILTPFSSDDDTIDFIYGVINWKELVDPQTQDALTAEVADAMRQSPRSPVAAPAWASGPSAAIDDLIDTDLGDSFDLDTELAPATALSDQLMLAQQTAAAVRAADTRSRAALYRALGRAYDFAVAAAADAAGYQALCIAAGIALQVRAPMTPVVKLVFGSDYDKTRLTEYAAVLSHARRCNVPSGALGDFLEMAEGGIKGVVTAERALRRPADQPKRSKPVGHDFAARPALASVSLETGGAVGDLVVLVARVGESGMVDIVGQLPENDSIRRALAKAAR